MCRLRTAGFAADEIDAILRRAAQAEQSAHVPAKHDLTVTELMEVAREVGLDPLAVCRSASIERVGRGGALAATPGAPDRREVRATMHGGLPNDRRAFARAADKVLGRSGDILEDEPERFVWRESHGVGRTTVTVSGEGAGHVSIVADRTGHYLVHWFLGLLGWAGLSSIAPFSVGPLAATLLLVTPVPLARPFWCRARTGPRARSSTSSPWNCSGSRTKPLRSRSSKLRVATTHSYRDAALVVSVGNRVVSRGCAKRYRISWSLIMPKRSRAMRSSVTESICKESAHERRESICRSSSPRSARSSSTAARASRSSNHEYSPPRTA